MSAIQDLLSHKTDLIDIKKIIEDNPWIIKRKQQCIISPDSDGLLSGLLLSYYLEWDVVGFYDGKVALIQKDVRVLNDRVCFIDIEIYRKGVRSMGHHMFSIYNTKLPDEWDKKLKFCIQPNLLRGYDRKSFRIKYPLATIHLLIKILEESGIKVKLLSDGIFPLLFVDGTYNVMFKYPENVMDWWRYLQVQNSRILSYVFMNGKFSVFELMKQMDSFFRERDSISIKNERGDRLRISTTSGDPYNIEKLDSGFYQINSDATRRIILFLSLLSKKTGWTFNPSKWHFTDLEKYQFEKSSFEARGWRINQNNWKRLMELNPLSWAMTSQNNIEFTLEKPDRLPY